MLVNYKNWVYILEKKGKVDSNISTLWLIIYNKETTNGRKVKIVMIWVLSVSTTSRPNYSYSSWSFHLRTNLHPINNNAILRKLVICVFHSNFNIFCVNIIVILLQKEIAQNKFHISFLASYHRSQLRFIHFNWFVKIVQEFGWFYQLPINPFKWKCEWWWVRLRFPFGFIYFQNKCNAILSVWSQETAVDLFSHFKPPN